MTRIWPRSPLQRLRIRKKKKIKCRVNFLQLSCEKNDVLWPRWDRGEWEYELLEVILEGMWCAKKSTTTCFRGEKSVCRQKGLIWGQEPPLLRLKCSICQQRHSQPGTTRKSQSKHLKIIIRSQYNSNNAEIHGTPPPTTITQNTTKNHSRIRKHTRSNHSQSHYNK